jgi:hypothetical protein
MRHPVLYLAMLTLLPDKKRNNVSWLVNSAEELVFFLIIKIMKADSEAACGGNYKITAYYSGIQR